MMGRESNIKTTPESRLSDLRQIAIDFSNHLKTSPGTILTPNQRLGVAICARDALLQCKGCIQSLNDGVCPFRLFSYCAEIKHEPNFPVRGSSDDSNEEDIDACLVNIIHTVILHQSKLDTRWYEDCISALQSCGILKNYTEYNQCADDANELELASQALFCEIILLIAMSHGIHSTFLTLGIDVPPLPTWDDMKNSPSPLDIRFSSLLHCVRRDESVAGKYHTIFICLICLLYYNSIVQYFLSSCTLFSEKRFE